MFVSLVCVRAGICVRVRVNACARVRVCACKCVYALVYAVENVNVK